jgi:hypothetical protein
MVNFENIFVLLDSFGNLQTHTILSTLAPLLDVCMVFVYQLVLHKKNININWTPFSEIKLLNLFIKFITLMRTMCIPYNYKMRLHRQIRPLNSPQALPVHLICLKHKFDSLNASPTTSIFFQYLVSPSNVLDDVSWLKFVFSTGAQVKTGTNLKEKKMTLRTHFQMHRYLSCLSVTCDRSVVFSGSSSFLHQ